MKLPDFAEAAAVLADTARVMYASGAAPAGAGNYSVRLADGSIAISVSGRDKAAFTVNDIMRVDRQGRPIDDARTPSAETLLHTALYDRYPATGAVLHSHAVSLVRRMRQIKGSAWVISGWEILKAFPGITDHRQGVVIPLVDNSQDMPALAREVNELLGTSINSFRQKSAMRRIPKKAKVVLNALEHFSEALVQADLKPKQVNRGALLTDNYYAYGIKGHGFYTWGATITQAKQILEAVTYLAELDV